MFKKLLSGLIMKRKVGKVLFKVYMVEEEADC